MAVTQKRPSSDYKVVGATTSGAASVAGATNDSNLGTYATGTVDSGFALLNMEDTSLVGVRLKSVQLRVQNANNGLGGAELQTGWLRLRDPVDGQVGALLGMARGTTVVDQFRGAVEYTAPAGRAWDVTIWNRMQVQVAWKKSNAGQYLRVHEIIADLDTNTQPTVSAVTVTGAASTTRPDVTFTYADTDGDPQTRARVKVFSAAQYGAAGFTADGSAATWDSGDLYGDLEAVTVPVDLVNGTTYRAYVRVAQDWPGPQGELWWSTWAQSANVTIAVVPPVTPTLTADPDAALPGYRVLLNVVAPLNLGTANQASLETDTAGWAPLTNCGLTRSTAWAAHGSGSLQMSSTAAGTMTGEWSTRPAVKAGAAYAVTATVRSAAVARTVRVGVRWFDQAGALIGASVFGTSAVSATGADTTVTATVTAPGNALTAAVVLDVQGTAAAAELHRWDKVGLQAGSAPAWSLGGNQGAAAVLLERRLPVRSIPGDATNWANPQLVSGGGVTLGVDGFYARLGSLLRSAPIEGPHPGGTAHAGARMIVWRPLVGAFNGLDIGLSNAATGDDTPPYLMPAAPGRSQTVSLYLGGSVAVNARLYVIPVNAANVQVGAGTEVGSATVALPTSGWTRYAVTITPPAGTVYLRGLVELTSGSADLDVRVTGVQCELGTVATALVPGSGEDADWETVRELDPAVPGSPGETYTAWDHEAPPARPVIYRARTVAGGLATIPSAPVAVYLPAPDRDLLKDPFQPENAMAIGVHSSYAESQSQEQTTYRPLGRDGDPVVRTGWVGGQDPSMVLMPDSPVALYRLRQLLRSTRPLLLQRSTGGQTYLVLVEDKVTVWPAPSTPRVTVRALECARPG